MYTEIKYEELKKKYGSCSSWAIWNEKDQKDTNVIKQNIKELNTNYVFVGLNIASLLREPPWSNFHGGKHDRKLMYACNDTKQLRGSYLTDIFKNLPRSKASEVKKYLKENPKFLEKNVASFKKEMDDIKVNKDTVFVVLGVNSSLVLKYFKKDFQPKLKYKYEDKNILNYNHYSDYKIPDEEWVNELYGKLGIAEVFNKEEWLKSKQNKA